LVIRGEVFATTPCNDAAKTSSSGESLRPLMRETCVGAPSWARQQGLVATNMASMARGKSLRNFVIIINNKNVAPRIV